MSDSDQQPMGSASPRSDDAYSAEPLAELPPPPSFQSVLLQFIKQFATVSTDLHQLTAPAVMLNGVSLLEYGKHWADHPELFAAIADGATPTGTLYYICVFLNVLDRIIAVVRWYVSTLFGSMLGRTQKSGGFERKPYNPILGEQFTCYWPDEAIGETTLLSEQGKHDHDHNQLTNLKFPTILPLLPSAYQTKKLAFI